ncbi:MAG TPA: sigma-70 family RNA polymerase sigma factor [Trebonia sp.]
MSTAGVQQAVDAAFREEWGRVVATLIRRTGDWDLAEECTQDAFAEALRRWPADGIPRRPGAWLTTVAGHRAIDRRRRSARGAELLEQAGREAELSETDDEMRDVFDEAGAIDDDRLRLIFTCCHPALPLEGRVALTLRTLAGLTTAEIARAFLVPEATMAKRLTRTRTKITAARIPYRIPPAPLLAERTSGVLAVLYLLFNEGYAASSGTNLIRAGLCDEAIRLARALRRLMPDEPEVTGVLALMLLHHSRRLPRPGRPRRRYRVGADRRPLRPAGTADAVARGAAQPGRGGRAGGRHRRGPGDHRRAQRRLPARALLPPGGGAGRPAAAARRPGRRRGRLRAGAAARARRTGTPVPAEQA